MAAPDTLDQTNGNQTRRWPGRLISAALVAGAAALVVLVAMMPKSEEKQPAIEVQPVNVKIQVVQPLSELPDTFTLAAVVAPYRVTRVAAEVASRVERFAPRQSTITWRGQEFPAGETIDEGEPVAEGSPLVYLNTELLQARFDQAEAQFAYDQTEFERVQDLYERGVTSKTEFDNVRARREVSKAVRDEAARNLARAEIDAPIGGILNRLMLEPGEFASSGDEVAEIVEIDRVKIAVDVPERDIYYLHIGDSAEINALAPEQVTLTGEITYISELADPDTRTTRVEITIDNHAHQLRSGQIVRARLVRRVLTDVIMIPLDAVIPLEEGRVVYVAVDGHAERRKVELGMIKGRGVRVLEGLTAGDSLIVAGHRYVGPGQPVTIVADEPPAKLAPPDSSTPISTDSP